MLIFDFDGVLINSLDEVTLTAYNAVTGKQVTSLADLPTALVGLFQHNKTASMFNPSGMRWY
jgi:beta-phosphoglucomutase-like phosphatase (HAD superfamily)